MRDPSNHLYRQGALTGEYFGDATTRTEVGDKVGLPQPLFVHAKQDRFNGIGLFEREPTLLELLHKQREQFKSFTLRRVCLRIELHETLDLGKVRAVRASGFDNSGFHQKYFLS